MAKEPKIQPIKLDLGGRGTLTIDGEHVTSNGLINVGALHSARVDLINGAQLTVNSTALGIKALTNITYGVGEHCQLVLKEPSINVEISHATTIDFSKSEGTGFLEYKPSDVLTLKAASPIKLINLHEGDTIKVDGATSAKLDGKDLVFRTPGLLGLGGTVKFAIDPDATFAFVRDGKDGEITIKTPCFLSGTLIATPLGEVPVEKLGKGDLVYTMNGNAVPVIWAGRRTINPKAIDRLREHVPIRIRPGALDHGTPNRDLYVSPDHCLFLNGTLIPAKFLVNGRSITQTAILEPFTYHHIELERHDVLIAEGAYVESYLDLGNKVMFLEPGTLMFTGPANPRKAVHCYPPVYSGSILDSIQKTLEQRAGELGYFKDRKEISQASITNVFPFYKQIQ
ncbi:Hint domain-containing protein [Phyllobacterium sp. OV277]|uniref:Hint domain-containing protein n=1 Tax=Phyllobacterium sp. OV277 TaxID=1882772 RepID=UPI00088DD7F6|nr:Hint domain-containing protein [Phyllobacterium sp. OV277]SDP82502.1 Hint domain-containing protein [Phyllobacterium sp. OV277]